MTLLRKRIPVGALSFKNQEKQKCPACKKEVLIVGEGDNRRYAQHGCEKSEEPCSRSLARVSWDE